MRDIQKAIDEYKRMTAGSPLKGAFSVMDLRQIDEISGGLHDPFELVHKSLMAGYAIGY